jgi:hypothetical protein
VTGAVRLHIRNEAMETHYINHLQLVEVRHRPGERGGRGDVELVVGSTHEGLKIAAIAGADR